MKELGLKTLAYFVLAVVTLLIAMATADCSDVTRILYDKGNSESGQTARFYFLPLFGIGIVIVQNVFIRWALYAMDSHSDASTADAKNPLITCQ